MTTEAKFDRACVVCGKSFQTNRRNRRTCSTDCSREWMGEKNRRAYHQKKAQTRVCKGCGKAYAGSDLAFCSTACRSAHYRRSAAANSARPMECPWTAGSISEDLRGVSPALGF